MKKKAMPMKGAPVRKELNDGGKTGKAGPAMKKGYKSLPMSKGAKKQMLGPEVKGYN